MTIIASEQTFTNEVLSSSVPVLVHFWAPWCGLCRMIDPIASHLKLEFGEGLKIVRINADENLKLANMYRLTSLPTVFLFQDGNSLQRLDEFRNGDDLRKALDDLKIILQQNVRKLTVR